MRHAIAGLLVAGLALGSPLARAATAQLDRGTELQVTLDQTLSTKSTQRGDRFTATVAQPVVLDGKTVVPSGSRIFGEVTHVQPPSKEQPAAIKLDVRQLQVGGRETPVKAEVTDLAVTEGKSSSKAKRNALIGGAGGAVVGGLVGGGLKGLVIGGALGAGAGTVIGLQTAGSEGKLEKGTTLVLRTTEPTTLPGAP